MNNLNKINIPSGALNIINILEFNGYEAYVVGGCVRDSLLGKTPHDWDICTNATPTDMQKCFSNNKTIETGIKHGTLTVESNNDFYEVTTFRIDGEYKDNRHPDKVEFVKDLEKDLSRRDFTANSIAYNSNTGLFDPFDGRKDIENKIIKCVGDPNKRFNEDALRILRAFRFACTYNFDIEEKTSEAMKTNRKLLTNVSAERINSEFCKILLHAKASDLLNYKDILSEFIPELISTFNFKQNNPHHIYDVYSHIVHTVEAVDLNNDKLENQQSKLIVKLAAFFHDIGKPQCYTVDENNIGHFYRHAVMSEEMAEKIMKRMKFDNATIKAVTELISYHDIDINPSAKSVRRMLNALGEIQLYRLLELKKADAISQNPEFLADKLASIDAYKNYVKEILFNRDAFSLKDLAINGNDLINIGITPGKEIGDVLNRLLSIVIENPKLNTKDKLITFVNVYMQDYEK